MPTIGIGGMLRPVCTEDGGFALELFARGRVGGWAWADARRNRDNGGWDDGHRTEFRTAMVEALTGVRLLFCETVGLSVGVRYEYNSITKTDNWDDSSKRADWRSFGPFVALSIEM
jgi:hypothetical protein